MLFVLLSVFLFSRLVAGSIKEIVKEEDENMAVEMVEDKSQAKHVQQLSSVACAEKSKGRGRPNKRKIDEVEEKNHQREDDNLSTIPKEETQHLPSSETTIDEGSEKKSSVLEVSVDCNVEESQDSTQFESVVERPSLPDVHHDAVEVEEICSLTKPIKRKSFDEEEVISIKRKAVDYEAEMYFSNEVEVSVKSPVHNSNDSKKVGSFDNGAKETATSQSVFTFPVSPSSVSTVSPGNKDGKQHNGGMLCRYCNTLKKNPKCLYSTHQDGCMISQRQYTNNPYRNNNNNHKNSVIRHPPPYAHPPVQPFIPSMVPPNQNKTSNTSSLCPTCKTHRKACDDPKHVEGFPFPFVTNSPKKPSGMNTAASINNRISNFVGGYGTASSSGSMIGLGSSSFDDSMNKELITKVQKNEEKAKERYLKHHDHVTEESGSLSIDSLVNQAISVYHTRDSSSSSSVSTSSTSISSSRKVSEKFKNALIMNIPKHEPLGKEVKPTKSAMKSISKNFDKVASEFEANPKLVRARKLSFSDEKNDKSNNILEEAVIYPAEENDSPLSVHSTMNDS
jgi:hypothetical protein